MYITCKGVRVEGLVGHGSTSMYITCKGVRVEGLEGPRGKHDKACLYFWGGNHI
jgi:hypothetical protein